MNKQEEKSISIILEKLEKQVDREVLKENDLVHIAIETWDALDHTSHSWHQSPAEVLKAVGISLFGAGLLKYSLGKVWNKLVANSKEKAAKMLQASKIIKLAKSSEEAIKNLKSQLGLNIQPQLQTVLAENKKTKNGIKKNKNS